MNLFNWFTKLNGLFMNWNDLVLDPIAAVDWRGKWPGLGQCWYISRTFLVLVYVFIREVWAGRNGRLDDI